jgi:hypothetical protein
MQKKSKRGDLTSAQIAGIILTIAGFIIALLFLLFILDIKSFSQDEICRLSVLTRATTPTAVERFSPLKCSTKKICFTNGKDCGQFIGEEDIEEIKLPADEEAAAKKIEEETANAMYDCWKMMGEGKLDVFGGRDSGVWNLIGLDKWQNAHTACLLCSRLAISDDVNENVLQKVDVNSYMENAQVPDSSGDTYLQKFTDNQIQSYPREFRQNFGQENEDKPEATNQISLLFMQISTKEGAVQSGVETGVKSAAFVFGTTSALGPFGKVLTLGKGGIIAGVAGLAGGGIAAFQTYRSRQVSAAYCGEFTSVDSGRNGCSVVTAFDYNKVQYINDYCSVIEGQP